MKMDIYVTEIPTFDKKKEKKKGDSKFQPLKKKKKKLKKQLTTRCFTLPSK